MEASMLYPGLSVSMYTPGLTSFFCCASAALGVQHVGNGPAPRAPKTPTSAPAIHLLIRLTSFRSERELRPDASPPPPAEPQRKWSPTPPAHASADRCRRSQKRARPSRHRL